MDHYDSVDLMSYQLSDRTLSYFKSLVTEVELEFESSWQRFVVKAITVRKRCISKDSQYSRH